jgi:hypothetical protein
MSYLADHDLECGILNVKVCFSPLGKAKIYSEANVMNVRRLGRGKLVVDYVHVKAKGH